MTGSEEGTSVSLYHVPGVDQSVAVFEEKRVERTGRWK